MNKYYLNDMLEIEEFIKSYPYTGKNDSTICLDFLTEITNETYLDNRAVFIKEYSKENAEFGHGLKSAASLCCVNKCTDCPIRKYCNHFINAARSKVNNDSLKFIDLFCGSGGLSLGFCQEGFIPCLANDIQDCCVDTYAHNHPEISRDKVVLGDIKNLVENIDIYLKGETPDIVIGGPPCQGFSMANRQRLIDDPRNQLYQSYVQVVNRVKPKFFVMENVKGMLSVVDEVIEDFETIGYKTNAKVLNAKDFGVPQNRERLIYIGNNIGVDNEDIFNKIEALSKSIPDYVLEDALFGLKPLEASRNKNSTNDSDEKSGARISKGTGLVNDYIKYINQERIIPVVCNHKARYNNDRDIEIFGRLNQGDKSDDPKIADIMPYKSRNDIFKDKYFKLENSKVCKTITAHMKFDCNMYIHPTQARGLTPREAARVQSYPDDYYFRGPYTKTYMQIGNSVPPLLGRAIATIIKDYL